MHFLSLSALEIVQLRSRRSRRSCMYSPDGRTVLIGRLLLPAKRIVDSSSNSLKNFFKDSGKQTEPSVITIAHITFRDRGGVLRLLEVASSQREALSAWANALRDVRKTIPRITSHAHGRWVLRCMAATSKRGTTGYLGNSELRHLLKRANASAQLSGEALEEAVRDAEVNLKLPPWITLLGDRRHSTVLNACQVTGTLLYLSCVSEHIAKLFASYAIDGTMTTELWLTFVRAKQSSDSLRITRAMRKWS
eukprot:7272586-Prymnesium_polylepis.3